MLSQLMLISLLQLAPPWGHGQVQGETHSVGGWRLYVVTDRFTGQRSCKLYRPKVDYQRQALVLHLSRRADTSNAVYRVDGGPLVSSRADDMELARLGFALSDDDLENPSGGLVRVPARRIEGASAVTVEVPASHRPIRFRIEGLAAALETAAEAGCPAGRFD
jgi:hypothetical protein